jgi:hypothetical protein
LHIVDDVLADVAPGQQLIAPLCGNATSGGIDGVNDFDRQQSLSAVDWVN